MPIESSQYAITELKASVESALPGETLQMSETDTSGLNTQAVLQWSRLLMPQKMLGAGAPRNFAYKQGGKCLTDFSDWASKAKSDAALEKMYDFTVQVGPIAIHEYRYWEQHEGWNGHRLHEYGKRSDKPHGGRPIKRDKTSGKVVWVAPGILFPIMSALSAFVRQKNGEWLFEKPSLFKEEELIRRAVQQFRALDRDVAVMGRSEAAYDALSIYTETIATVLADK